MPAFLIDPSYADLVGLIGHQVSVNVDDSTVSLWLESISTLVCFEGYSRYSVHLTSPSTVDLAAGVYVLHSENGDFRLNLQPVGRDVRFLRYEAYRIEISAASA
jgi:Domain of unknown function (DUF6916)